MGYKNPQQNIYLDQCKHTIGLPLLLRTLFCTMPQKIRPKDAILSKVHKLFFQLHQIFE